MTIEQISYKKRKKNILVAAVIGSILEWYDFLLYVYFTPLLAPLFFPSDTQFFALIKAYGVFAIGFLVRPFGAIVIGRLGDLYGRRKALIFTMTIMTVPTVAIGLLPTYQTIGILAPILLTLLRCAQGFAVSGEINTASSFLVEHAHKNRRGFSGSLIMAGAFAGMLFGAIVVALFTEFMPEGVLAIWGWRLPFLLAGVFGIFGLIIRLRTVDPSIFSEQQQEKTVGTPIKSLFLNHWPTVLRGICITASTGVGNYFLLAYFNTFLVESGKFVLGTAMIINSISIIFFIFSTAFFGFLSDIVGRKRLFAWACSSMIVAAIPSIWLISQKTFSYALSGEILFAVVLGMTDGLILTLLAELFSTKMRNSGSAITYNVSLAIFGGTSPLIAITLAAYHPVSPAIYLIACSLLSLLSVLSIKETHKDPLK